MSQRQIEERLASMRNIDPSYGPTPSETGDDDTDAMNTGAMPNENQISWTGTKNTAPAVSVGTPSKHSSKYFSQKMTKWVKSNTTASSRKEIPTKKRQRSPSPVQSSNNKLWCLTPLSTGGSTERGELGLSPPDSRAGGARTSTPIKNIQQHVTQDDTICVDISLDFPSENLANTEIITGP